MGASRRIQPLRPSRDLSPHVRQYAARPRPHRARPPHVRSPLVRSLIGNRAIDERADGRAFGRAAGGRAGASANVDTSSSLFRGTKLCKKASKLGTALKTFEHWFYASLIRGISLLKRLPQVLQCLVRLICQRVHDGGLIDQVNACWIVGVSNGIAASRP